MTAESESSSGSPSSQVSLTEALKKALLAGLGVVAFTRDRLSKLINELVEQGEITRQQGSKLLDRLVEQGAAEGKGIVETIGRELEKWLAQTPLVTRSELRNLEERIRALESRLGPGGPPGNDVPEED